MAPPTPAFTLGLQKSLAAQNFHHRPSCRYFWERYVVAPPVEHLLYGSFQVQVVASAAAKHSFILSEVFFTATEL